MKRVTKAVWYTEDGESFTLKSEALAHETRIELVAMAEEVLGNKEMAARMGNAIADDWKVWLGVLRLRDRRIKANVKVLEKAVEDF